MALLDKLLGRHKREESKSASALTEDALRDTIVSETEQEVPRFRDLTESIPRVNTELGEEQWHNFGEAVRDVARAAFSYDEPQTRGRDEMLPSHLFNREVVNQMLGSPEFQASRMYTSGNAADSLFTAIALGDVLQENAQKCAEHVKRSNDAAEHEDYERDAQQEIESLRGIAQELHRQGQPIPSDLAKQMRNQVETRQMARDRLQAIAQEHRTSNASAVAYQVAQQGAERANEQAKAMHTVFGLAPGSEAQVSPEQRIKLAEQWTANERLRKILEMAGRLVRDMRAKRQAKTKDVNIEPVGITTGRDIGRMLPHELARAFMPELRPLWIKDYSERSLLQYRMSGKDRVARGDVIVVKDGSGSMDKENRIEWASSVQLAALSIAQREKRGFAGIEFSGTDQCKTWLFPKGRPADPEHVLDMASHFYRGGGTSILTGLRAAKAVLDAGEPFTTADIILLTDGQCAFGEEDQKIVNELRAMGVRIHGISILAPKNKYLTLACDWQTDVAELAGGNEATDRLATEIT